jgi:hypothetical protein
MAVPKSDRRKYVSPLGGIYDEGPAGVIYNRNCRLVVMVTAEEFQGIRDTVYALRTSVSGWLRHLALKEMDRLTDLDTATKAVLAAHGVTAEPPPPPKRTRWIDDDERDATPADITGKATRAELDGGLAGLIGEIDLDGGDDGN